MLCRELVELDSLMKAIPLPGPVVPYLLTLVPRPFDALPFRVQATGFPLL